MRAVAPKHPNIALRLVRLLRLERASFTPEALKFSVGFSLLQPCHPHPVSLVDLPWMHDILLQPHHKIHFLISFPYSDAYIQREFQPA